MKTPKGDSTRPTSDRVKESLFNILAPYIADAEVLDLFAGTGNLGIEALSRGARFAVFVDKSHECSSIIRDNLSHTKLSDKAMILASDVVDAINKLSSEKRKYDLIFLDPPYHKNFVDETLNFIEKSDIIKGSTVIIAESDVKDRVPEELGALKLMRSKKYGDTLLSFYYVNKIMSQEG